MAADTAFDVDGVRVIHRLVPNDVVAANIYLLGGARQLTAQNAGIEPMLLDASERGTRAYGKEQLRRVMAHLGSSIVVEAADDWTMFGARTVPAAFDSTWAVLADRLMNPTLDSTEVEFVRDQFLTAARQRRDNPDALVEYLADSVAFAGHPYARSTVGTEQSIAGITLRDLRRYHSEQIVKSRVLVVVVGDIPRAQVERLVRQTLAKLPAGSYRWTIPDTLAIRPSSVAIESRVLPTNYILGYYAGPPATSADYQALRIGAAVLSGRLFAEVRGRRNLSYAVDAPFVERALGAGGLYVTTVAPDSVLRIMRESIVELQEGTIGEESLDKLIQQFITQYFLDNETNAQQATFLARAQLYRGDYRKAERFVEELRAVTPLDVQRAARRYMRNVHFAYVGDPKKISAKAVGAFE